LKWLNYEFEYSIFQVRSRETNLGNFFCDILLNAVKADCALLNSGSFRSDQIHKAGDFKMRDLRQILPFLDESIVIQVTGRILHQMLENGVSKYPSHDGRFLQSSGVLFSFDPSQPAGKRIDPRSIKVQNELIELDKVCFF
jgi:5'-nucleotidase